VIAVTFYDSQSGLPSNTGMSLFKYRENVFFATEKGIYQFNQATQVMEPAAALQNLMGDRFYRRVIIDRQGNIWNFTDSRAGVYRLQEDGSYLNISSPFEPITGNYIGGFEYVYPYDDKNVFFGVENGFIHYDPSSFRNYKQPLTAYIREMNSTNADTVLFRGMVKESFSLDRKISFNSNSVQFYFSANDFENPERLEYSTRLEGPDGSWSGWSSRNSKEFTNLIEGDYTFRVKARNIYLEESPPVSLSFSVAPPWRRSLLAYVIYGFMMVMAIVAVINLVRKKINRSKREAELAKERQFIQREAELKKISLEAEKEVIRLRNEKLNEEMLMKDKELANSTLQQIQKNKLLVNLIHDLKKLANSSHEPESRAQIRNMIKKINKDIDAETQWKVFEKYFENVHEEFLKRIKSQYPDLTPRELKLCAYLRLNISSKEIALLMNISARGVEISRYRLRRKLKLEHTTNLTDFIISF
jgi:DNA-binding CsgD family transcriptional regulator